MQAVAQVADLVVALDELLAQPLDLLRGVTNKLGIGITANGRYDLSGVKGTFGALGPSCVVLEFSWVKPVRCPQSVLRARKAGGALPIVWA